MIPSITKRFTKEIEDAKGPTMTSSGIYYWFNETNIHNGKAMIIGPENTPYANCPLIFNLDYPADYPFSSPTVTFMTSDGTTRFHPNLYVTGKVCLSILGTWKGPKWSPAMTISSILSSIQSLLEENPIVNEPSWETVTLENVKAKEYAEFVKFRLIALTFRDLQRWKRGSIPIHWIEFEDVLKEQGDKLYRNICADILKAAETNEIEYTDVVYKMSGSTAWKTLAAEIRSVI